MIDFKCPKCGTEMSSPGSLAGQLDTCPSCAEKVHVPHAQEMKPAGVKPPAPPPPSMAPNRETKGCPYCGEEIKQVAIVCRFCGMNIMSGQSTRGQARTPTSAPPPIVSHVAEETLWEGNPTRWSYFGAYFLAVLLIPVLVGIPFLIWAILDRKRTVYTISNKRVIQKRGIIGRTFSEVDLKDIRNVLVEYGVVGRLLGFGDVGLGTAAQAGIEIKMKGCENPEHVRRVVVDAKERAQQLSYRTE